MAAPKSRIEVGKPMPATCPACGAIPREGYCIIPGCPMPRPAETTPPEAVADGGGLREELEELLAQHSDDFFRCENCGHQHDGFSPTTDFYLGVKSALAQTRQSGEGGEAGSGEPKAGERWLVEVTVTECRDEEMAEAAAQINAVACKTGPLEQWLPRSAFIRRASPPQPEQPAVVVGGGSDDRCRHGTPWPLHCDECDERGLTVRAPDTEGLREALAETGCRDYGDLVDMAKVGLSLMDSIDIVTQAPGPFHNWTPADDPAEIVTDLINALDEARAAHPAPASGEEDKLRIATEALEKIRDWKKGDPSDRAIAEEALTKIAAPASAEPAPSTPTTDGGV